MTTKEIIGKLNLDTLVEGDLDREVTSCYIGDLLSWVMGSPLWVTSTQSLSPHLPT